MLNKHLEMQKKLDNLVLENKLLRGEIVDKKQILTSTILALMVEVGEFANENKCFKHWSTKPPAPEEEQLEEFIDCYHFMLSIANQMGWDANTLDMAYNKKYQKNIERQNTGY